MDESIVLECVGWVCPVCSSPISPYIDICPVCCAGEPEGDSGVNDDPGFLRCHPALDINDMVVMANALEAYFDEKLNEELFWG